VGFVERERARGREERAHFLKRPSGIFEDRAASSGLALSQQNVREILRPQMAAHIAGAFAAGPIVDGVARTAGAAAALVRCPHDRRERIGTVEAAS
ncbi:hypothetical protein ABTM33_18805, partial [Acinetobacter baumannii]